MPAGQRDTRLVVQEKTTTEDGAGQKVATWKQYDRFWASVTQLNSGETSDGKQTQAETGYEFEIDSSQRSRGITTEMRILVNDRTLYVGSVNDIGFKNKKVIVTATERT